MIELTVKTLDSQNHQFTVEDDITVEQFKVKIAETVNIPAETQRIIYCGRVLQDTSKLADYDVHGKVVHLVQRAPPGSTPRPSSRSSSPQTQRRTFRGFRGADQGNSMYLASMAFPGNLMESQGIVPPPPTHNLSGSRLVVASRMLRRAEAIISLLENPNARSQDQNTGEENQEEEVTTVIEARVLVPNAEDQPMNDVINVVQNSLLDATRNTESEMNVDPINVEIQSPYLSGTSTPAAPATPRRAASAENLNTEARTENAGNGLPENASPTSEMAELLTTLGQLQTRFAPFLERYHRFMQEDPEVPAEDQRQTQTMLNRVSEVMHFLGHAYHSLSDIIVRVRAPPPRPLLCRPILIQHSAVLQTGIPIQVEINLPTDRQAPPNSSEASATTNSATSSTTTTSSAASTSVSPAPNTTAATSTGNSTTTSHSGGQSIPVSPAFVGLPFLPGAVRVQSFPIEIRSVRSSSAPPRSQNNNNNTVPPTAAAGTAPAAAGAATNATGAPNGPTANPEGGQNANAAFNFNNPNVEFFMEVTPEGITIDSLETTLVDSNRASDLLRGALNGPPPEFLQSLMQMAGQIMSRNLNTTAPPPASSTSSTSTTAESTSTTGAQAAATNAGQNSQARGNTQTNPTTATHTRSTPRPHVHLAQQAMQGGFDPFLPCNSHHISRRNRMQAAQFDISENVSRIPQAFTLRTNASRNEPRSTTQNATSNNRSTASTQANATQPSIPPNIANIFDNILESIRPETRPSDPDRNRHSGDGMSEATNLPFLGALASGISGRNMFRESPENLTLYQLFREGQEDDAEPGESILGDLQMLISRNLSWIDMVTLTTGSSAPIHRFLPDIRNFILTRVCNGDTTQNGIDRGVENVLTEIRPTLQTFGSAPCYDDTDIVRSIEELLRQRLPNIINIGLNLSNYSVPQLISQCGTTLKQILALFLYIVRSQGHGGSEQVIDYLVNRLPSHNPGVFPVSLLRIQFREYLRNLNVPNSVLQPYLVRSLEAGRPSTVQNGRTEGPSGADPGDNSQTENVDTMEIDDAVFASSSSCAGFISADKKSDRWRSQVTEGWLPVMRQRRQNPPTTFSDTYLASMPSKRRKLVNNSKPQDSLPQVISDTVREAVTATGLEGIAPLDSVADEAGASSEIQAAYRSLLRTTVQASLEDNEDFVPERFPNVANYFNKDLQ